MLNTTVSVLCAFILSLSGVGYNNNANITQAAEENIIEQAEQVNDNSVEESQDSLYAALEEFRYANGAAVGIGFKIETENQIQQISYATEGFEVVSSPSVNGDTINVGIRNVLQKAKFTLNVTLSSGTTLHASVFGLETEVGFFISKNSHDDAKTKYFDYELEHGLMTQDELEDALAVESRRGGAVNEQQLIQGEPPVIPGGQPVQSVPSEGGMQKAAVEAAPAYVSGYIGWVDDNGAEHPLQYAKVSIFDKDPISNDTIGTVYSDANGNYAFSYTEHRDDLFDSSNRDVFIRAYAGGENTMVKRANGSEYFFESDIFWDMPAGGTYTISLIEDMSTDLGRAFQISQAVITGARYVKAMKGSDIAECKVVYPDDEDHCFYTSNTKTVHITGRAPANAANPESYASWDVILHEYGHHVAKQMGIEDNPGGWHELNTNMADHYRTHKDGTNTVASCDCTVPNQADVKSKGIRLAWGEAWPTTFGIIAQKYYLSSLQNIDTVGDESYDSYNSAHLNLETTSTRYGDACEASIIGVLWDLYDGATESHDTIALGYAAWWNITTGSGAKTFSGFAEYFYGYYNANSTSVSKFGQIAGYYNMAATGFTCTTLNVTPPTFYWSGNGGSTYYPNDVFYLAFYDGAGERILTTSAVNTYPVRTLTPAEWNSILYAYGQTFTAEVFTFQQSSPVTLYFSQRYAFTKPTLSYKQDTLTFYSYNRIVERSVTLAPGQYIDYYITFQTAGAKIFQTFGSKDAYLELYNSSGTKLAGDSTTDDAGYAMNAWRQYYCSANVQYRVRIRFWSSAQSGTIRLMVSQTNGWTNTSLQNYEAIWTYGTGTINASTNLNYTNYMIFTPPSTKNYTFKTDRYSADIGYIDTYLYIIDPRSASLTSAMEDGNTYNDDGGGNLQAKITTKLTAGVPYLIVVSAYNPSVTSGQFKLIIS
jgi:hypothetical protein